MKAAIGRHTNTGRLLDDRQQSLTLGAYPDLSLKEVRRRAVAARERVSAGEHLFPAPAGAARASGPLFGAVKDDWLKMNARADRAPATLVKADCLAGLASSLDSRSNGEIRAPDILAVNLH